MSYESLPAAQARTYRRLAWHPGPEITTLVASCVTGHSAAECEETLRNLAQQHLLTEHGRGRYRFHDLLRLHAEEKAAAHETDEAKDEGVDGLMRTFAELSVAADTVLRPYAGPGASGITPVFTDPAQAAVWLDTEKDNLVGLVELAARHDRPRHALRLVEGLWPLFLHHGQALLWLRAGTPAIRAARELGDETALGRLLNKRALVHSHLSRVEEAIADLEAAERIWLGKQEWKRVAQTRQRRGILAFQNQHHQDAVAFLQEALAADEHTGGEHNKAVTLFMLGRAHLATRSPEKALGCLERALPLLDDDAYNRARVRIALGSVLMALSQPERARREAEAAQAEMLKRGSVSGQGKAWEVLGEISEHQGDVPAARAAYESAMKLLSQGDPARRRVQGRLDGLG
ncbi:tetratricopeptide (TPR) repeat protein [Nocardiopsis terrae]|uniref:Tetratricopeptide (TPR) repeat protein n=1 Tax=Nocardiopsis terrae TaxID=372655 RepID=A0ABR9HDU0_9ACTN|nr:tetratricopeptide repeat protein [Nocardiopsis terrae]MBE1457195.1 tetratricopeptide (TPR) repeat protein [Nocardiopsis terrae]